MKKLRVGIIGTGNWAVNAHIPAYLTPVHGDYYDGLRCQEIMSAIEASFVDGCWHSTHLS